MHAASVLFVLCLVYCYSAGSSCSGSPNTFPISVDAPILMNSTTNGKYFVQNSVSPPLAIVHVYGSPYEMGFAQGSLMKEQINILVPAVSNIGVT